MAYISNYLFTGINHNITFDSSVENIISYNDTFTVGTDLYFGMNIAFLNQLRTSMGQGTIAPPGVGNYTITVFLCDSIDGGLNFVNVRNTKQYTLGPLQTNSYIYKSINTILENYSNNDQLLESMSTTEIQKLKKSFKIIFRINLTSSPVLTQSIQNGDFVQDLYILADTMQPGPYEVVFENVDILSPSDFSNSERKSAYSNNINLLGFEGMRCFYPKNISSLAPLPFVFCIRANAGDVENYDAYMGLFASYGYFCASLFQDVTSNSVFMFDNGIYNMSNAYSFGTDQGDLQTGAIDSSSYHHTVITIGYLDHLQKNWNKISSGKFANQIDFTKLISMGHSRGGGAAYNVYELLLYKNNANNLIAKFNTNLSVSDLKCIICLAPNKGDVLQSTGSLCSVGNPIIPADGQSAVVPPYVEPFPNSLASYRYSEYTKGISWGQYSLLNASNVSKLKLNTNIPILFLYPEYDQDTNLTTETLYRASNLDSDGNVINSKKLIIVKKSGHEGVATPAFYWHEYNGLKSVLGFGVPSSSGIIFNNMSSRVMYLASKTLEFIANNVYSANINSDVYNNPNDFDNRKKTLLQCFEYVSHPTTSSIISTIDIFNSVNYTTNISGATIASAISKDYSNILSFISTPGYTSAPDLFSKGLLFFTPSSDYDSRVAGGTYPINLADKMFTASGKGLVISFDGTSTEYNLTYTYPSTKLNLSSAKFIQINAAQISSAPLNQPSLNETPLIFDLRITDSSNRASSLSCLNYNDGIADPSIFLVQGYSAYTYSQLNSINFRLQDFIQKTANIDFANIQQIDLFFGSLHGSTAGTIFIDSIYATNPPTDYSMIASAKVGGFLAYITRDGTVRCIGDFSPGSANIFDGYPDVGQTTVPASLGKCKQVDCGYQHTLALQVDGTMVAWGSDANKQGKTGTEAIQAQITAAGRKVKKIACGGNHNLALLDNGSVVAWGQNEGSQLSDANTIWTASGYTAQTDALYVNSPELSGYIDTNVFNVLRRHYRCSAFDNQRATNNCESPYRSGFTAADGSSIPAPSSVVGTGWETITNAPYDYQFARNTTGISGHVNYSGGGWTRNPNSSSALGTSNKKYVDIAAGRTHNILLAEDGTIEVWGLNFYYAVTGSGPHSADGRTPCDYITHVGANCFRRSGSGSGSIPWGDNTAPTVKLLKTTPNSVGSITASYYNCAVIKSDGTLFVWDRNESGESLPTSGLPTGPFKQIFGGKEHFIALKTDGTVVCWGNNDYGQCTVPANLSNCTSVGAGRQYSYAIKSDGSTVFWGDLSSLGGTPSIQF